MKRLLFFNRISYGIEMYDQKSILEIQVTRKKKARAYARSHSEDLENVLLSYTNYPQKNKVNKNQTLS